MEQAAIRGEGNTFVFLSDIAVVADARLARYAHWLGDEELARWWRFVRIERKRQFIAGRALLRLGLGRLLGVDPGTVALRERPGQAPELIAPASEAAWFSISHSGPWVGCAVTTGGPIGFDIERIDSTRDVLALAEQAFDMAACAALEGCAGDARSAMFYRMWCEYEARIKLGQDGGVVHSYALPGVAGALVGAHHVDPAPAMEFVGLGDD